MMRSRLICSTLLFLGALTSAGQTFHATPESGPASFGGGTYSYDPASNVIAIDSQAFLYDPLGRLTEATVMAPDRSMVTQSYTYDVYGNLQTMNRPGVLQTLSVDPLTNHLNATGAKYDAAGNITEWKPPGTSTTYNYGWDELGNMQTIRLASQPAADLPPVAYLYTVNDERISAFDVPNLTSHWAIRDLGGQVLTDFLDNQGTWSWTRDYFYRDGTMLASAMPTVLQHYTVDHLGSPRLITDDLTRQIAAQTFLPFGEELQATFANGASIKKFTGHERDSDIGLTGTYLDYMHARYYSATWGRFLSVDPVLGNQVEPQSWNRYVYVRDNPVNATDPDGRDPLGAALGAYIGYVGGAIVEVHSQGWGWEAPIDYGRVSHAAIGGAIAGGIAGACDCPAGLSAALGGAGNVVGGAATRHLNGEKQTPTAVAADAIGGAVGSAAGAKLGQKLVAGTIEKQTMRAAALRTEALATNAGLGADKTVVRSITATKVVGTQAGGALAGTIVSGTQTTVTNQTQPTTTSSTGTPTSLRKDPKQ
jgi:RHS repeat-associated protein